MTTLNELKIQVALNETINCPNCKMFSKNKSDVELWKMREKKSFPVYMIPKGDM